MSWLDKKFDELKDDPEFLKEEIKLMASRITELEQQLKEAQEENSELKEEVGVLFDCLNGSTKAKYTAELYDRQVNRAEAAETENKKLRGALGRAVCDAKLLYTMLDEIDTAGDMYKPEHTTYFKAIQFFHNRRHEVAKTDGFGVEFYFEQALKEDA